MFERVTERAVRVIMASQEEAKRLNSPFVGAEHLMLGMLRENEKIVIKTLEYFRVDPVTVKERIESEIKVKKASSEGTEIPFTPQVKRVIELSWDEARSLGHSYVGVEHLFLGIIKDKTGITGKIIDELGIDSQAAKSKIISILGEAATITTAKKFPKQTNTPVLDSFSRDLTFLAKDSQMDPGYIRDYPAGVRENGAQYNHAALWSAFR